jgi:NADP-dependent 3-hydroxy acid dehydrogenase YdfG
MEMFKDYKVYITGGTSGLGFSLAERFIELGAIVYITGRNSQNLLNASKKIKSDRLITLQCDIKNLEEIKNSFKSIDRLSILINNAGVWLEGELVDNPDTYIQTTIDTNLTGLIFTTKYAIPLLKKSAAMATVVNISSTAGIEPKLKNPVYAATKYAVRGFTECMNQDFRNKNIRFIGIYPGGMNTPLFANANINKNTENYMDPNDVANIIIDAVSKPSNMVLDKIVIKRTKYN